MNNGCFGTHVLFVGMTSVTGELRQLPTLGSPQLGKTQMFVEAHVTIYTLDVNCRESKGILYDWVYLLVPLALDPKIVFEN